MAKESKAFGSQRAAKAHLVRGSGGLAGEIGDLRKDVEEGFQNLEERAGFPELYYIDGAGPSAAGADMVLKGANFLQGQTFDEITIEEAAAGSVVLTALKPGDSGITVEVALASALDVAFNPATGVLLIELPAIGDSDDDIATAINADGAATDGYVRATSAGSGDIVADHAAAPMTGGVGDYAGNVVKVGGVECLPANTTGATGAAAWADATITVTVPALTPIVATDQANVTVMADGTRADALGAVVQA